jgi:predicted RNase H-like nuclease (RuvC/YqgF family)
MPEESQNGWSQWSKVVLHELERMNEGFEKLTEEFQNFKVEVAKEIASKKEVDSIREEMNRLNLEHAKDSSKMAQRIARLETELKIKAGLFGALGSLLGVVIMAGIAFFK